MLNDRTRFNQTAFFLICLTLVFITLAYGGVHQPILALFYILIASIAILIAVDAMRSGSIAIDRSRLQLPLFAAAIFAFIQVIPFGTISGVGGIDTVPRTISIDPFATQLTALHFAALAIFFSSLLILIDSTARIRKIVGVIIVFGFLYAFFAILQAVLSPTRIYGIYENPYASPFGSFVNRHNFAAFMEMSICLPLGMLFSGSVRRDKRLLFITAVSLMGIALLLSGSRGGFVATLAGALIVVIQTRRSRGRHRFFIRIVLVAALFFTVIGGAIFVGGESSLSRFVETAQSKDVSANRLYIWRTTTKVIAANMPFGAGFGAFGVAFTEFDTNGGQERVEQAHNDYLQVAADAGVVGIAIGGAFLFWLFRTSRRSARVENTYRRGISSGAFAGIGAVLVHSLFDFVLHTTAISLLFLILMAIGVASGREYDDDVEEKKRRITRSDANIRFLRRRGSG